MFFIHTAGNIELFPLSLFCLLWNFSWYFEFDLLRLLLHLKFNLDIDLVLDHDHHLLRFTFFRRPSELLINLARDGFLPNSDVQLRDWYDILAPTELFLYLFLDKQLLFFVPIQLSMPLEFFFLFVNRLNKITLLAFLWRTFFGNCFQLSGLPSVSLLRNGFGCAISYFVLLLLLDEF